MITFVTRVRVAASNAAAFEALLTDVRTCVRAREPGVLYYDFAKSVAEPDTYAVIEVYCDPDAHAAHMQADWIKSSLAKSDELVENGGYDIKQYVSPGAEPARTRIGTHKT